MSDEAELDSSWYNISRLQPPEVDVETLLALLKHKRWEVRFNAVRELREKLDEAALKELLKMFKREKQEAVRHMLALTLSAYHEAGMEVPLFADAMNPTEETRRQLVIKYGNNQGDLQVLVPHKLDTPHCVEVGFLMAQLVDIVFPEQYEPLADIVPSAVLPAVKNPAVSFVDSHPHGMKYRIYGYYKEEESSG
jgi:hypothetical protein